MVSLEHSSTHYRLGRSSCLSPGAACQVPCPLPYSCLPFLSLQVNAGLEGRGQGGGAKTELTPTLTPIMGFFLHTDFPPNNEKWPLDITVTTATIIK